MRLITLLHKRIIYRNASAKTDKVTRLTSQNCVELARITLLTFGYLPLIR